MSRVDLGARLPKWARALVPGTEGVKEVVYSNLRESVGSIPQSGGRCRVTLNLSRPPYKPLDRLVPE